MKITIFTSNQPRHVALINRLANFAEVVYVVQEVSTVHPGMVSDFYGNSETMHKYLSNVQSAEAIFFPSQRFTSNTVKTFACKMGDLNRLRRSDLEVALDSDLYVVFGSSFITGWLCDFLVGKSAINLHMGLSPYYRGAACNFWAMYDQLPNYVGATWHYLSNGLDSGPIIFHSIPKFEDENAFGFTMKAVLTAQEDLILNLDEILHGAFPGVPQEKRLQLRYSRYTDFTDEIAQEFLQREYSHQVLSDLLHDSARPNLLRGNFSNQ
jgi:hypothetical protein